MLNPCSHGTLDSRYVKSLELKEKALGPEHPDVAISLHNLAEAQALRGELAAAEASLRRALAIDEKHGEFRAAAVQLDSLAHLLWRQERPDEAKEAQMQAIARAMKLGQDPKPFQEQLARIVKGPYHIFGP